MEHLEAVQQSAVEKYLLDELTPELRNQFEEHFFSCDECAEDLCATSTFLNLAKGELRAQAVPAPVAIDSKRSRRSFLWTPAFLAPALAALLLVVAYQNVVVFPRMTSEVATLENVELLPSINLVGANSRGGGLRTMSAPTAEPFLLLVDIPSEDRFSSYTCELLSPSGASSWHLDVSAQQAKDTVSIRVPGTKDAEGTYTLVVRGNVGEHQPSNSTELARYSFVVQHHG